MKELKAIIQTVVASPETPGVLATLVDVAGSSYRRPGARLLLSEKGVRIGSISGGCLEEDVIARARRVRETGRAEVAVYDTTSENDLVWGVGLGCHGVVHVLLEKLSPRPDWASAIAANWAKRVPTHLAVTWRAASAATLGTRLANSSAAPTQDPSISVFNNEIPAPTRLLIFGAGDDAQSLQRLANELGWDVTVADPRAEFATANRFPGAEIVVGPAANLVERIRPGANAVAVIMTHHYVHDVPVLRSLLPLNLSYVGLLGPKKRGEKILTDIAWTGDPSPALHMPIGLDIGAETPEEVAISIIAEITAALSHRTGGALRDRDRPIHS